MNMTELIGGVEGKRMLLWIRRGTRVKVLYLLNPAVRLNCLFCFESDVGCDSRGNTE